MAGNSAALLGVRLRFPLARYIGHRHGGCVQQAPQNSVELGLWDFGGLHILIITQEDVAFEGFLAHNRGVDFWR